MSKEVQARGYRIIPVKSAGSRQSDFCETVYASLKDIPFPVILSMFTAAVKLLPDVARDFLEADAKISGLSWAWKMKKEQTVQLSRRYRHGSLH